MPDTHRKNTPRLRDGVMKRDTTWSYVIRVKDPETGISKPRWVGGFATEEDAKAARDEARVKARHGEYIDRNRVTVATYLNDWIDAHAMEIKPRTLADYRACIRLYATPRIGHLPIQAVRPSTITKLYRDLLTNGGRDGQPLAVATVTHLHAVLRKAFGDAVIVDELIGSNPVERAKRPRAQAQEPGTVWTIAQLRGFLVTAQQHRLWPIRWPSSSRRLLARHKGRICVHDGMGRANLPRYRHVPNDQAHPRQQAAATPCTPSRPQTPACHDPATLRRPGACRRRPPGPRRSGYHLARVCARHPLRRGRCRRYLRPGREGCIERLAVSRSVSKGHFCFERKNGTNLLAGSRLSESNR
jgi:hypothetical protein